VQQRPQTGERAARRRLRQVDPVAGTRDAARVEQRFEQREQPEVDASQIRFVHEVNPTHAWELWQRLRRIGAVACVPHRT